MDVQVKEVNGVFIAEFTATQDFNIHIEKSCAAPAYVYQRTTDSGEYASLDYYGNYLNNKVIDTDFSAIVYPKHILIKSEASMSVKVSYNS